MKQQTRIQAQQSDYFYIIFDYCMHVIAYREVILMAAITSKAFAAPSFALPSFGRQSGKPMLRCVFYLVVDVCWGCREETLWVTIMVFKSPTLVHREAAHAGYIGLKFTHPVVIWKLERRSNGVAASLCLSRFYPAKVANSLLKELTREDGKLLQELPCIPCRQTSRYLLFHACP